MTYTNHEDEAAQVLKAIDPGMLTNDADSISFAQAHATIALVQAVQELREVFTSDHVGGIGYDVSQALGPAELGGFLAKEIADVAEQVHGLNP